MQRAFKYMTILNTNVAQPMYFTTLTNAIPVSTQLDQTVKKIVVADTTLFFVGDWVLLVEVGGTNKEKVNITEIVDATHMTVRGSTLAHAAGAWVAFDSSTNSPYVETKLGNAATMMLATDYDANMTTGFHCVASLPAVAAGFPSFVSTVRPGSFNPESGGNYWIIGTTGDSYLPSFGMI